MKQLFLAVLVFTVVQSVQAQVQFTYPKSQPITVVIVDWFDDTYAGIGGIRLKDESGHTRMYLAPDGSFVYTNPTGQVRTDWLTMEKTEARELFNLAKNARRCPLTLQFDRASFQVLSAAAGCDPFE